MTKTLPKSNKSKLRSMGYKFCKKCKSCWLANIIIKICPVCGFKNK